MSREKPDRAACVYVPEPDGPITRPAGDVVAVRMKDDAIDVRHLTGEDPK